jgi:hypothetical protein
MRTINNWKPETRSLLKTIEKHGLTLYRGNNGEYEFAFNPTKRGDFVNDLTACDESALYVTRPDGKRLWISLIYGNSPGELMSDYSVDPLLDLVSEEHGAKWENRKQPTKIEN